MEFAYTAKSSSGEIVTGVLRASTAESVHRRLREQELFPMMVKKQSLTRGLLSGFLRKRVRVGRRELLSLTTQLAIMTRSGIDLAGALKTLSEQCKHRALKKVLGEVHEDVTGGKAVSESLRKHTDVFGDAYVASVAAGEATGRLPDVLQRLSHLQRMDVKNRQAIRTLLAYPLLLVVVSFFVILGLVCFVLPQFAGIFSQFDVPLPLITQVLIGISTELRSRLWLWGPLIAAGILTLILSRRTHRGRRLWDRASLNTLLIRDITQALLIGRTFRMLGLMIESGVPLLEGLRLVRSSIRNSLYHELFNNLEDDILNGRGISASLVDAGFVPPAAAEMVLTAEKTGTLGMVTQLMGEYYEEEGEAKLREVATMIEPMIIVVMGAVVAMVVMSVMLPMFEIATLAR